MKNTIKTNLVAAAAAKKAEEAARKAALKAKQEAAAAAAEAEAEKAKVEEFAKAHADVDIATIKDIIDAAKRRSREKLHEELVASSDPIDKIFVALGF